MPRLRVSDTGHRVHPEHHVSGVPVRQPGRLATVPMGAVPRPSRVRRRCGEHPVRGQHRANNTYVEIRGEDLEALPEIVDGWREVTLRFEPPSNVPVMDGST